MRIPRKERWEAWKKVFSFEFSGYLCEFQGKRDGKRGKKFFLSNFQAIYANSKEREMGSAKKNSAFELNVKKCEKPFLWVIFNFRIIWLKMRKIIFAKIFNDLF